MNMTPIALATLLAVAAGSALAHESKRAPKPAEPAKPAEEAAKPAPAPAGAERGRDWTAIDTNKDGYISPDEMEAWLKANPGPQR